MSVATCQTCKTCTHWTPIKTIQQSETRDTRASNLLVRDPLTMQITDQPFEIRVCVSPRIRFFERPAIDGGAILDGSEYFGELVTGPEFGCAGWESR